MTDDYNYDISDFLVNIPEFFVTNQPQIMHSQNNYEDEGEQHSRKTIMKINHKALHSTQYYKIYSQMKILIILIYQN